MREPPNGRDKPRTPRASDDALATPTVVDPRAPISGAPIAEQEGVTVVARPPRSRATGVDDDARTVRWEPGQAPSPPRGPAERAPRAASEPLRVVSMKTPGEVAPPRTEPKRELPAVQLRALSDLRRTPAAGLGRLAPPRDPAEARSRRMRDLAIWGSVAVIVACGVTLLIWFVAG